MRRPAFKSRWPKPGGTPAELPSSAKETEAAISKALDEKTQFEFVETELREVVEFIVKKHNIQILLNKKALDDAGLGTDTPITCRLRNISLRSALRLTLRDFDLTWVIEDEVLQITTLDDAGQRLKPIVYDVTDLLAGEGGADYDTLIDTITTIIAPTTWDQVGGPGSIAPFPLADPAHAVVISQTMEVHDQIAQFLADVRSLRAARKGKVDAKPAAGEAAQAAPADPNAVSLKIYKVAVPQAAPPRANAKPDEKGEKSQENLQQYGSAGQFGIPNDRYLEELARAIPALVRPETWERAGGEGVLYALPADMNFTGHLLVRQTGEVQRSSRSFSKSCSHMGRPAASAVADSFDECGGIGVTEY